MRKNLVFTFLFCCLISVYSQKNNIKNDDVKVYVYIMPDSLELPSTSSHNAKINDAIVKSKQLNTNLSKLNIKKISKAFPNWKEVDSLNYREEGPFIKKPEYNRIFLLYFETEKDANKAIEVLNRTPGVIYSEKDSHTKLLNDVHYNNGNQWHLNNYGQNYGEIGADVNAEGAWSIFTGNPNIKIAILDSGVETWHEDLDGKASGDVHQGSSHGTAVAGIAAAKANNTYGGRGLDWNARIISYLTHNVDGTSLGSSVTSNAINSAVNNGAHIINCSWGGPDYSLTQALAFAYAYKMNKVVVVAMGNDDIEQIFYPAALSNVIAVGATNRWDSHRPNSKIGNHIDVVAPGENIFTTKINDEYTSVSGTSFSAPLVSGLASLLKGYNTNLENDDICHIIRLSAKKVDGLGNNIFNPTYGYGRINAGRALSFLNSPYELVRNTATNGVAISVSDNETIRFMSAAGLITNYYSVKRVEVKKIIDLPNNLYNIVGVWGRGVSSTGWGSGNPNFGEGFCEVVPGSITSTSFTLRTYVYEVWDMSGSYRGYHPTSPANAIFAYSILGHIKPTISGPSDICPESNGIYTIENLPANAIVTWSKSDNIEWVSMNNNNVVASCSEAVSGLSYDWLKATIINNSDTIEIEKNINACKSGVTINGSNIITYLDSEIYSVNTKSGCCPMMLNYEWWLDGTKVSESHVITIKSIPSSLNSMPLTSSYYLLPPGSAIPTIHSLELRAKNNNGDLLDSDTKAITIYGNYSLLTPDVDIISPEVFAIYPNPVDDMLTVNSIEYDSLIQNNNTECNNFYNKKSDIFTVLILNERNGLIKKVESGNQITQISLQGLPVGIYFVNILKDGKIIHKQIIEKK